MSLNILITGSSGFLGSKICEILNETENNIVALDIASPALSYPNISYICKSIDHYLDENKNSLSDFDLIIHTASVLPYKGNEESLIETNIKTTKNLVEQVKKLDDTFFIYISSSGIYGKPFQIPVSKSTGYNPLDLYAQTKITSEINIEKSLQEDSFAIIRPRTILGINRKGIFEIFFKLIKYNLPLPLPNNGKQKIQFVDVEDLAKLIIYVGFNREHGKWPAGAPEPIALKEHLEILGSKLNKKIITVNINPKLFEYVGILLIKLNIINFTKWHFGSFPYDFYFDSNWKPKNFEYKFTCEDTFLKSAETFFDLK